MDPYTRPVADMYRKYLSKHVKAVDSAVRPIYDKHAAPLVNNTRQFFQQKAAQVRQSFDDGFAELVSLANKRCESSKKEIESAPVMIRKRMRNVCNDPAVVIRDALRMITVMFLILLRRPIWNTFWGTLRMVTGLIWYLLSFGFLRTKKPPLNGKTTGEAQESNDLDTSVHDQNAKMDETAQ